jgi:hypothetical protein
MPAAVLTPFTTGQAVELANRWWKRLLPVGELNYKGRTLKFTRDYLAGLVSSFQDRAYDQVPFQLAGDENKHTNDVERFGGQIDGMELRSDGLWISLDPTARGEAVLKDNPGVGVSARIVEGYERSDGKFYPGAIQHVLATLDPRIPALGPWQAVEATNDDITVTIDLSGAQFAGEEPGMPELNADQQARLAKLLEIDPAALAAAATGALSPGDVGALNGDAGGGEDPLLAWIDTMSDDELLALEAEMITADAQQARTPAATGAPAALSNEALLAVELAQASSDENSRQLSIITGQLDHERWIGERSRLVAGGTPPFIADLAQPLLEGSGHVVDLSGGVSVDAGQITRKILTEYAKVVSALGFETGVELGSPLDEPEGASTAATARNELVARARGQLGL